MKRFFYGIFFSVIFIPTALALPMGFVYLKDIDPSIQQDIRYASHNNVIGKPLHGYVKPTCILTEPAALALKKVQQQLKKQQLSLKVYDCYRPQQAVNEFWYWSQQDYNNSFSPNYYPRVKKSDLFKKEYIALYSGHTRGSTVDLTVVPSISDPRSSLLHHNVACYADYSLRRNDNSLDMGTNFDCLDPLSHIDSRQISVDAHKNRRLLRNLMRRYGFAPYHYEWWHFTLKNEPFPRQYYDFPVQ